MSAAPRAQTEEQADDAAGAARPGSSPAASAAAAAEAAAAADAEGWALLEGLRRRLDEHANQQRKTQTDVRQLAESIGALVGEQRKRSRWINVNSFVAYLIFTLLCSLAFYFVFQSRARELISERDRVKAEKDAAIHRADDAIAKTTAREDADKKAVEAFDLLEAVAKDPSKRDVAAKKLKELQNAPLSKLDRTLLDARAKEADVLQVASALKGAQASFKAGRYADVVQPLEAALLVQPSTSDAAMMHYYLGIAYSKAGALDQSIAHLEAAVTGDVDVDDALFHLATVRDRAGQWAKAKIDYDRFATAHPMSPYAASAMRRGATLARFPAVRPASATPAQTPAASPAATAPAATAPRPVPAPAAKAPAAKAAVPKAPTAVPTQPQDSPQPQQPQPPAPKTIDFNDPSTE